MAKFNDSEVISETIPSHLQKLTSSVVQFFVCGFITIYYSWQLTLFSLITSPIGIFMSKWYGPKVDELSKEKSETNGKASATVEEVISNMRTVRAFAAERREIARFVTDTDSWLEISLREVIINFLYDLFWTFLWRFEAATSLLFAGYLAHNGRLEPANFVIYFNYKMRLHVSLLMFNNIYISVTKAVGKTRPVVRLLTHARQDQSGTETPPVIGHIVFGGVEFAYPTRPSLNVLHGINLSLEPGKTVALVGHSGNGKSTLVNLLQQYYQPSSGRILLDGTPIENFEHQYFRQMVSIVSQEPTLFSGTVRDNILYGYEQGTEEDMMRVARMANVDEFVARMEDGYDTMCGERGVKMSGGQKQRIAIARALVRNPRVLILDEATSALDVESEALVQEALNRCSQDMTVLVIAHRLSTVRNADKIAVIENGGVSA
ncbi:hypothetical protein B9Z55_017249 [Caenorhabditis nigoni]|uniref:ABC transporter domain-containing protein n=1 Tax=Caenorhabditis nigoni TaxID=1611254 RepID=A0A2G5T8N2_9PELO|nr:hypothetical protein B9Z55_017249 [Caenorhabditis nigoni]